MGHKQPQPCSTGCCGDGGCPDHGNQPPFVICNRFIESGVLKFYYKIENAATATLTRFCDGAEPVVTDLTELLVDGAYEVTSNIAAEHVDCVFQVCASNPCATRCCGSDCGDVTIDLLFDDRFIEFGATLVQGICGADYGFTLDWSYQVSQFQQSTSVTIELYRAGNVVQTINLPAGKISDSGQVDIVYCDVAWESLRFFVITNCNKIAEVFEWANCRSLVDFGEIEITNVTDIVYNCYEEDLSGPSGYDYNIDFTFTGLTNLNDTHEIPTKCNGTALTEGVEVRSLGAFTASIDRLYRSGAVSVDLGGNATLLPTYSNRVEIEYTGTIYMIIEECLRVGTQGVNIPGDEWEPDNAVRFVLVYTATRTVTETFSPDPPTVTVTEFSVDERPGGTSDSGSEFIALKLVTPVITAGCSATSPFRENLNATYPWYDTPAGVFAVRLPTDGIAGTNACGVMGSTFGARIETTGDIRARHVPLV